MTKIDEIAAAIELRAYDRFEVRRESNFPSDEHSGDVSPIVLSLRRKGRETGSRTILVVQARNERESLRKAFMISADARDSLAEPEASDLYMIMSIDGVSDQDAARIETDDRFCRKYVLREGEDALSLLDRSFLVSGQGESQLTVISDPFRVALTSVAEAHPWVRDHVEWWRGSLLSGDGSGELVDRLLETAREGGSYGNP